MKNTEEKPKNKNKESEPKIINGFLICGSITFCLYKPRKKVDYDQNLVPTSYLTRRPNKSNLIYPNHSSRYKTKYGLQIDNNLLYFIKLAGLIHPIIPLYITNLSWPILLALYFIKCKMVGKMSMLIIRPFENNSYFMQKRAISYLSTCFNIEKMLIHNPVLDASSFNFFFLCKTLILQS